MYNGKIINQLLLERKIKKVDLVKAVGWSSINQLDQAIRGNPTVATLERLANFFHVSMDVFFVREDSFSSAASVMGNGNNFNNHNSFIVGELNWKERTESMKMLLEEKDKRIETLERILNVMEHLQAAGETEK